MTIHLHRPNVLPIPITVVSTDGRSYGFTAQQRRTPASDAATAALSAGQPDPLATWNDRLEEAAFEDFYDHNGTRMGSVRRASTERADAASGTIVQTSVAALVDRSGQELVAVVETRISYVSAATDDYPADETWRNCNVPDVYHVIELAAAPRAAFYWPMAAGELIGSELGHLDDPSPVLSALITGRDTWTASEPTPVALMSEVPWAWLADPASAPVWPAHMKHAPQFNPLMRTWLAEAHLPMTAWLNACR